MRKSRPGFSMIEAVITLVIVGGLMVAALNTVGASRTTQYRNAQRTRGMMLAQELMTEIMQLPYKEPGASGSPFGKESGETARAHFDDVDDYANWFESPPTDRAGVALPGATGWARLVYVIYVDPNNITYGYSTDRGAKIIYVISYYNNRLVGYVIGYRTEVWQPGGMVGGG